MKFFRYSLLLTATLGLCAIMPTSVFASGKLQGVYRGGVVLSNGLNEDLTLTSYSGDTGFNSFMQRVKSHLENGNILKQHAAFRVAPVEDLWQGKMVFKSSDGSKILNVYYNGEYAPDHGRGLSCATVGPIRCQAPGNWGVQQQLVQVYY